MSSRGFSVSRTAALCGVGLLVVASATTAHVQMLRLGPDGLGPLQILARLFSVLVALAEVLLTAAFGRFLLRRFGMELTDPVEGIPVTVATGMAAAGTILLIVGTLGGVSPTGIAITFVALAALSHREIRETPRWLGDVPGALGAAIPSGVLRVLTAVTGMVVVAFLLTRSLGPPTAWDALMYHVDVPSEYLRAGRVYLPADNLHAVFVGPVQLLYMPLLAVGAPAATAVLNALLAILLGMIVIALASRHLDAETAALSGAAVWANTTLLLVAVTPRVDAALVFFLLVAFHALMMSGRTPEGRRWFLLAAGLLGASVGVKLHAMAWIAPLLPAVGWLAWRRPWERSAEGGTGGRGFARTLVPFAVVGVAAALPWLLRTQLMVGTPFYPLLSGKLLSPWLADLVGPGFRETLDPYVFRWLSLSRQPFDFFGSIFAPGPLTIEWEGRFYFTSALVLLAPLALLSARRGTTGWLALAGIGYLACLLLTSPRTNLRYILPAVVPLTIVAAHGLLLGARRLVGERWAGALAGLVTSASLIPTFWTVLVFWVATPTLGYSVGLRSEQDMVAANAGGLPSLRTMMREVVPKDARVLMLNEARGFGLGRDVIQDNTGEAWSVLVASGLTERCLRDVDATHILRPVGVTEFHAARGIDVDRLQWTSFEEFAGRCLKEVAASPSYELFEIPGSIDRNAFLERSPGNP